MIAQIAPAGSEMSVWEPPPTVGTSLATTAGDTVGAGAPVAVAEGAAVLPPGQPAIAIAARPVSSQPV